MGTRIPCGWDRPQGRRWQLCGMARRRGQTTDYQHGNQITGNRIAVVGLGRVRQRRQTHRLRGQIARDLHDEIGSNLSSIGILSQLGMDAAPDTESMRHDLEEIRRVSTQTADSMHDIVWLISPGKKTAGDLAGRLRETAGLLLAGMEWTIQVDGLEGSSGLTLEAQRDFFLIFKEALHNIRRHSAARHNFPDPIRPNTYLAHSG